MTILWDWNGTLLDDAVLTLALENRLFAADGLRQVSMDEYRMKFCFPVRAYYESLGICGEDFDRIAGEWAALYRVESTACTLMPDAARTVRRFHEAGFRQVILSASEQGMLREQVARYPQLDGMFDDLVGLNNVYAGSKVEMALDYLRRSSVDPADAVFLGDTLHDAEVARAIGCRCMLISAGHQAEPVLLRAGFPVLPSLTAAADSLRV